MELILSRLDASERSFLESRSLQVLDWGCAMGDGVDALATALPKSTVTGLDRSAIAIAEARKAYSQHTFLHSESGEIDGEYDVIVTSNCLEHFEYPLEAMEVHARSCRHLYIVLVPYNEHPLLECHRSQFRSESFPKRLGRLNKVRAEVLDSIDTRYWPGEQMLVVYASDEVVERKFAGSNRSSELDKWNAYYSSLPLHDEDEITRKFNGELAEAISEFLDPGSRVLEAGCGGGWQSLALARKGYDTTLMDFSEEALAYSKRIFDREGLPATFIRQDVFNLDEGSFDLVFNAGVIEHYTFNEQIRLLRGMASRSKKFVLVLAPSSLCYWYWVWRMHVSAAGEWVWGKEVPMHDLSGAFAAAGLRFLGQRYMGVEWSEHFITTTTVEEPLRSILLTIHRSPLIRTEQKAYLVAALGVLEEAATTTEPAGWQATRYSEDERTAEFAAALADSLSQQIQATSQFARYEADRARLESRAARAEKQRDASHEDLQRALDDKAILALRLAEAETGQDHLAPSEAATTLGGAEGDEIARLREEVESERRALTLATEKNVLLEQRLQHADHMRRQILEALRNFTAAFDASILTYRNQRAWQVMLLIRKLYSNLFREGREGRRDLLRFLLRLPIDGIPPLGRYDLTFPVPLLQMPRTLSEPWTLASSRDGTKSGRARHLTPVSKGYDVIVLPVFEFDFRFQRPQQLSLQFGKDGHRVFWISPGRVAREGGERPYEVIPLADNVWEVRL
ncbi:MAG: methyltransferase domain-containing protein, partial [Acidobacteria bacterium]|nr:methyltransferase domain-containing protein [Acidobacteriota bacterium]